MKKLIAFLLLALVVMIVVPQAEATQNYMWSYAKGEITKSYMPWQFVLNDTVTVHISKTVALGNTWSNVIVICDQENAGDTVASNEYDTLLVTTNKLRQRSGTGHLTWTATSASIAYGDTLYLGPMPAETLFFTGGHGSKSGHAPDSTLFLKIKAVR